jgi:hypothetical protein
VASSFKVLGITVVHNRSACTMNALASRSVGRSPTVLTLPSGLKSSAVYVPFRSYFTLLPDDRSFPRINVFPSPD